MNYTCPVCLYKHLPYPPKDYHICPCCSTEFGNDDERYSVIQLREMWVAGGANWFFGRPPQGWNPWKQLIDGGHLEAVPPCGARVKFQGNNRASARLNIREGRWMFSASNA